MGRPVILSNGRLAVGLDERGLVHDFYYPFVGLDNLTTARSLHHRIGVWVDGTFSWTDEANWEHFVDFSPDELVSNITMRNNALGLSVYFRDFVDHDIDAFCRIITIKNDSDRQREVRLFMHQVFEISQDGRADTAQYVPEANYILNYKGPCVLAISGLTNHSRTFDQYAVGNHKIEGKQGTYMDAEDGELSGHAVEHGGVDSVLRFAQMISPNETGVVEYWIAAADTQFKAEKIHDLLQAGLNQRLVSTQRFWRNWLSVGSERLASVSTEYQPLIKKSLMTIKAHIDQRGGIIASCDSSIYNYGRDYYSYVWPRDGAYAVWPLIRLGYTQEPKAFFRFCSEVLAPDGFVMHKYQPDKGIGSTWHPLVQDGKRELAIQEDETAILLIMLGEYYHDNEDDEFLEEMCNSFILPAANFLASFIDEATGLPHASYDLWEQKFICSTYTTATVYRALLTAADLVKTISGKEHHEAITAWQQTALSLLQHRTIFMDPDRASYRKGLLLKNDGSLEFDNTLDVSSLYGIITFGYYTDEDKPFIAEAIREIEAALLRKTPAGGVPRYENDGYFRDNPNYPGNPWIVTSMWLAQFYTRFRKFNDARHMLSWAVNHTQPSGVLPEQIHPENGTAVSVTPLVWSHAELINTVLDLSHIQENTPSE